MRRGAGVVMKVKCELGRTGGGTRVFTKAAFICGSRAQFNSYRRFECWLFSRPQSPGHPIKWRLGARGLHLPQDIQQVNGQITQGEHDHHGHQHFRRFPPRPELTFVGVAHRQSTVIFSPYKSQNSSRSETRSRRTCRMISIENYSEL